MVVVLAVVGAAAACVLELVGEVPKLVRTLISITIGQLLVYLWLGSDPWVETVASGLAAAFLGVLLYEALGRLEQGSVTVVRQQGRGRIPRV